MINVSAKLHLVSSVFASQGIRIITTLVLARLLTPEDYGYVALVTAIPGVVSVLGDFGIGRGLILLRDIDDEIIEDTAFVVCFALSLFYAAVSVGGGIYLAIIKVDYRLLAVASIHAGAIILGTIYNFQLACLLRKLNFGVEARLNIYGVLIQAASGIAFAVSGFGVFTLVLQSLMAQIMANLMVSRARPLRLPRKFALSAAKRLLSYGWKLSIAQYASNVQASIINLIVAKQFGPVGLGYFGRALQVKDLIGHNLLTGFDRVLFPSLSAEHDAERKKIMFQKTSCGIFAITVFGGAWMCITSNNLIKLVLGTQWGQIPPLIQVLAIGLPFTSLGLPPTVLCMSKGKLFTWLKFSLFINGVTIPAAYFWGGGNLKTLCFIIAFIQSLSGILFWLWALSYLQAPFIKAFRRITLIMLCGLASGWIMWQLQSMIQSQVSTFISLTAVGIVGLASYALLIYMLDFDTYNDFSKHIFTKKDIVNVSP